uniref:Uncharacterized protein n=1 Tax=Arundo donax TaxID=35708 RepID=A0A0A9F5J1_ARUDO
MTIHGVLSLRLGLSGYLNLSPGLEWASTRYKLIFRER